MSRRPPQGPTKLRRMPRPQSPSQRLLRKVPQAIQLQLHLRLHLHNLPPLWLQFKIQKHLLCPQDQVPKKPPTTDPIQPPLDPQVASLQAIFPDFDAAVLYVPSKAYIDHWYEMNFR